jgi:hypothetical protein
MQHRGFLQVVPTRQNPLMEILELSLIPTNPMARVPRPNAPVEPTPS